MFNLSQVKSDMIRRYIFGDDFHVRFRRAGHTETIPVLQTVHAPRHRGFDHRHLTTQLVHVIANRRDFLPQIDHI